MRKLAEISLCGNYRYSLERIWDAYQGTIKWILLNPSTADAYQDDATIRRLISFTKTFGFNGMYVYNLFAYRSKNPKELLKVKNPIGDKNNSKFRYLNKNGNHCDSIIIIAWGNHGKIFNRDKKVLQMLKDQKLYCLGITKQGQPKHPLYLSKNTKLIEFPHD